MYFSHRLLASINVFRAGRLLLIAMLFGIVGAHASEPQERTIALTILDGKVVGDKIVKLVQGQQATLLWTADNAIDIHLHGYDIEKSLEPGIEAAMVFDAYATGRFPVTVHGKDSHSHGGGERALIYLEVYPE